MVDSQVLEVGVLEKDGSTALTIQVVGFAKDTSVEISGYITQDSGAFASFHETGILLEPDSEGVAELKVTVPPKELKLIPKENVRVLTWVSKVWPSMLIETTPTEEFQAAWKIPSNWSGVTNRPGVIR